VNADQARTVLADLLHRIAPEVELDTVDPDAALQDEVDLDSMDFLNLVTALHETTGIDVPERDYPSLSSVSGFVDYVVARST
jgi:acyl carrier protein